MLWLRFLYRVAACAVVGFAMVTVAVAIAEYDSDHTRGGLYQFGPMALLVLLWVVGLPLVGWLLLRVLRVRPAGAVAVLSPITLFFVIRLWEGPQGGHGPPWQYGLRGVVAYAVTALVMVGLAAIFQPLGPAPTAPPEE